MKLDVVIGYLVCFCLRKFIAYCEDNKLRCFFCLFLFFTGDYITKIVSNKVQTKPSAKYLNCS